MVEVVVVVWRALSTYSFRTIACLCVERGEEGHGSAHAPTFLLSVEY